MKAIAFTLIALTLTSCSFTGKYASATQNFDWATTIILPVEDYKK